MEQIKIITSNMLGTILGGIAGGLIAKKLIGKAGAFAIVMVILGAYAGARVQMHSKENKKPIK